MDSLPLLYRWTARPYGPDGFTYYHVYAQLGDLRRLYEYGQLQTPAYFTRLEWNADHLVVYPNLLYVQEKETDPVKRYCALLLFLDRYFQNHRLITESEVQYVPEGGTSYPPSDGEGT